MKQSLLPNRESTKLGAVQFIGSGYCRGHSPWCSVRSWGGISRIHRRRLLGGV